MSQTDCTYYVFDKCTNPECKYNHPQQKTVSKARFAGREMVIVERFGREMVSAVKRAEAAEQELASLKDQLADAEMRAMRAEARVVLVSKILKVDAPAGMRLAQKTRP
jgi:hypothetical protein